MTMSEEFPVPQPSANLPPFQPKARFFCKRFWTGFGAATVVGACILFGGLIVIALIMRHVMGRAMNPAETGAGRVATGALNNLAVTCSAPSAALQLGWR
jgi:hypothetical protein